MALPTRILGSTGLEITVVGFGAWAAGGGGWSYGWGPQDDEESVAAMVRAVEHGVNWIDTAAVYGLGHSEEVVARALGRVSREDRPLVFTKCGLETDSAQPMADPVRTLRPESIRRECEASLRRLRVDRIDLYQCHWPDPGTPIEDAWAAMARLQEDGKVRAIGVSNFDVPLLERCHGLRPVGSLQPPFSAIRRDSGRDVIPWCREHDVGVIVYSPMQAGLLTDAFSARRSALLPPDDWRRRVPYFREPGLSANLALRDALRPIAKRHGCSVAAVAVAWTLAWPGVTGAIVGARDAAQVDGWIGAAMLRLVPVDFEEIAAAIERTGAGSGPVRPAGP
ncbi:MAG: aldo/keto reductase [Acidobacteriota bacterium]